MGTYAYRARTIDGRRLRGELGAFNLEQARKLLQQSGVFITSLTPMRSIIKLELHRILLKDQERLILLQSWATYLQVGLSMHTAILRLRMSTRNRSLARALEHVQGRLDEGKTLTEALKLSRIFPLSWIGLIEIGEERGDYVKPMLKLHEHIKRGIHLRREFIGMLMMPLIVLTMVMVWFLVFVTRVIPTVVQFLALAGAAPVYLSALDFVSQMFLFFAHGIGIFILGAFLYARFSGGPDKEMGMFQRWVPLSFPVLGPLVAKMHLYVVASSLCLQLEAGINIIRALETLARGIQNRVVQGCLLQAHWKLRKGSSITEALSVLPGLTDVGKILFAAGEMSSQLPRMLKFVAQDAEADLMEGMKRFVILLRSFVVLATGIMVGLLILACFTIFVASFTSFR